MSDNKEIKVPNLKIDGLPPDSSDVSVIRTLVQLEGEGITVTWQKKRRVNTTQLIREITTVTGTINLEPEKPTTLVLYTNQDTEDMIDAINDVIYRLRDYLDYQESLKDNPDIIDIKSRFLKEIKSQKA